MNSKEYKQKISNKSYVNYILNNTKLNKNHIINESLKRALLLNKINNFNTNKQFNPNPINNNENINNNYLNKINNTEKERMNITPTDPKLIFCIKMLGITKYYSNFSQNKLNFDDFLSLTHEEMNSMKIPKNIQNLVKQFSLDYINSDCPHTLDDLKKYFSKRISFINNNKPQINNEKMSFSYDFHYEKVPNNKINNNNMNQNNIIIQKRNLINNYIQEQDIKKRHYKINNNIDRNQYNNKNRRMNKSASPSHKNNKNNIYNNSQNIMENAINNIEYNMNNNNININNNNQYILSYKRKNKMNLYNHNDYNIPNMRRRNNSNFELTVRSNENNSYKPMLNNINYINYNSNTEINQFGDNLNDFLEFAKKNRNINSEKNTKKSQSYNLKMHKSSENLNYKNNFNNNNYSTNLKNAYNDFYSDKYGKMYNNNLYGNKKGNNSNNNKYYMYKTKSNINLLDNNYINDYFNNYFSNTNSQIYSYNNDKKEETKKMN